MKNKVFVVFLYLTSLYGHADLQSHKLSCICQVVNRRWTWRHPLVELFTVVHKQYVLIYVGGLIAATPEPLSCVVFVEVEGRWMRGTKARKDVFHSTGTFFWLNMRLKEWCKITHSCSIQAFRTSGTTVLLFAHFIGVKGKLCFRRGCEVCMSRQEMTMLCYLLNQTYWITCSVQARHVLHLWHSACCSARAWATFFSLYISLLSFSSTVWFFYTLFHNSVHLPDAFFSCREALSRSLVIQGLLLGN